jgi:SAM-dependent methyltransferase
MDVDVRLLPREALIKSGSVDHADWNYRPILGWLQRIRFRLAVSLLPSLPVPRMLEVGYGSGIFMPELATSLSGALRHRHSRASGGCRPHPQVARHPRPALLLRCGDHALLQGFFDTIVGVSSLEFVQDIDTAARELARVLQPHGALVMVTPGHSPLLDFGLRVLTGESARRDYGGRRETVMPGLSRYFTIERGDRSRSPAVRRGSTGPSSSQDPRLMLIFPSPAHPLTSVGYSVYRIPTDADPAGGAGLTLADDDDLFEKKIRPVLHSTCLPCHGADKTKGGLRLDSRDALLRGGDSGPAIKIGDPSSSLLLKAIRQTDPDLAMPPKKAGKKLPTSRSATSNPGSTREPSSPALLPPGPRETLGLPAGRRSRRRRRCALSDPRPHGRQADPDPPGHL